MQTSESITDEKNDAAQERIGVVSSFVQVKDLSDLDGIHSRGEAEVVLSPPLLGLRKDVVFVELGDGIEDLLQESTALQVKVALREVDKQKRILFFLGCTFLCGATRKLVEIDVAAHFAAILPKVFDERSHISISVLAQNDSSIMGWYVRDILFQYLCLIHRSCVRLCWRAKVSRADNEKNCAKLWMCCGSDDNQGSDGKRVLKV